jgi:DNA repair exonuclease SbcCD nuclease subunit
MSKIFLIGDSHIGLGYPNKTEKWFRVHQEYFSDFLIPLLKEKVSLGDIIVHLGDLFDNRNVIPINLLNYGMDVVEKISTIAPLHIIVGNHDLWSKSSSEVNSIRPFKWIPNVSVYDSPETIEYNGLKILMMPYIENRLDQIDIINSNKDCDYLFCHSDLNGCKMHLTSVAHKNSDKIDINDFKSFSKVMSGHIHLVQKNKNFTFCGSIFQMDRNDIGDQKGIFVIDTNDGSEEFYPNMISPIFKKIDIKTDSDIDLLTGLDTKDYIDIRISNNLLINNRKLRRKLEIALESGNFASVEYIDDMMGKNSDDGDEILESHSEIEISDGTVSIELDYEDYIRDYIKRQNWDNEKYTQGVLDEYEEIIRIYNDNYKSIRSS